MVRGGTFGFCRPMLASILSPSLYRTWELHGNTTPHYHGNRFILGSERRKKMVLDVESTESTSPFA